MTAPELSSSLLHSPAPAGLLFAAAGRERIAFVLHQRILEFIRAGGREGFDELVLAAYRYQAERIEPLRLLSRARGLEPGRISDWRQIPPVPAQAFKSLELATDAVRETFRSSGTTGLTSFHHHCFPELYRAVIDATFPKACIPRPGRPPMLGLLPDRRQAPASSLSFLADHVMSSHGGEGSAWAFGERGVELRAARSWLAARQRDGRPALLLATTLALVQLLEGLERMDLRLRLPAETVVFDTGGSKGRKRRVDRRELLERLQQRLGIAPQRVVREYGMTELTSHFYTAVLGGGDPDLFLPPPWTRVRILDPENLGVSPEGEAGLISVVDLANLGSTVHLLTQDLGRREGEGFRLLGRAAGAELRGCSLVVEELEGA